MFEYAVVDATGHAVRPGTFMASIAGELGLVGLAILLPLVFVDALPQAAWLLQHTPLVGPPPAKPLDPIMIDTAAPTPPRTAARETRLYEPLKFPSKAAILIDDPVAAAPPREAAPVLYGLGDAASALHPALEETLRLPPPKPSSPVKTQPPPTEAAPPLLRVGGKVRPPVPVFTPAPEYPPLARATRVEGVVNLEAIIAADGTIRSLKFVKGHALLAAAAIAAVRTWRYTPPTLNGEPIELEMFVDVRFKLNN